MAFSAAMPIKREITLPPDGQPGQSGGGSICQLLKMWNVTTVAEGMDTLG